MTIHQSLLGSELTLFLSGRLDTTSAPELSELIKTALVEVTTLVLDVAQLEYISSAGLRVLLTAQKTMNRAEGKMILRHVNASILEVFEVTGFISILTVEPA